jgi:hypothetical protein
MEKKFNYVYVTTNLVNGFQYIGDRSCNCDPYKDEYLGSGVYFKRAEKQYGKDKFEKKILECFELRKNAYEAQEKYIKQFNTLAPNGYNISPKGGHQCKNSVAEDTKIQISIKNKGKHFAKHTAQHNENISKALKGKNVGKKRSEETLIKYSVAKKGKPSNVKGKHWSEESKERFRKPKSEEAKHNMSIAKLGKPSNNKK